MLIFFFHHNLLGSSHSSSTFLSKHLAWIPAVVGPTIAEIVPLDGEPELVSWKDSSDRVCEIDWILRVYLLSLSLFLVLFNFNLNFFLMKDRLLNSVLVLTVRCLSSSLRVALSSLAPLSIA